MQWIPRQYQRYVLSNIYLWMGRLALTLVSVYGIIGESNMFTNIPELYTVIALSAVAVVAWIGLVQYSRWQQHIKANIPYLIVPVLFGALAVCGALWVTDYVAVHGYFTGAEELAGVALVATIAIYCVFSKYLVSHVGDAVYFQTIENKVVEVVEEFPNLSEEDKENLRLLKLIKKLK